MKKYLVIGGNTISRSDGQLHYITPQELVRLYGVREDECIMCLGLEDPKLKGVEIHKFTVLRPRKDGNYVIES